MATSNWSEPENVIDDDLAKVLIRTADLLAKGDPTTPREIELWIEHLAPVRNTPARPDAWIKWAAVVYQEGLTTIKPDEFTKFVSGEIPDA